MTLLVFRRLFLVATPLVLGALLWLHPAGGEQVYEGVRDDVGAWFFVHTAFLFFTPLMAIATYLLLRGLESRAANVSRVALVFFLVFYTAYEVTVGAAAGAGWAVTLLVGFAALFAVHPPPVGPVGLVCFAAAAGLIERAGRATRGSSPYERL